MGRPLRILHLEDRDDEARRTEQAMEQAGLKAESWRVQSAALFEAGLRHQSWDLILASCTVPGFDGVRAAQRLREGGLDIPLILLCDRGTEAHAVAAMKAGAQDYLLKDDLTRLAPALERELRQTGERRARQQAEQALRETEASLAAAQHLARLGSWELELAGPEAPRRRPVRCSEEVFRILGYPPGSLAVSLETLFEAIHPEDRERIRHAIEATVRERTACELEHRLRLPDGTERLVHQHAEVLCHSRTGQPLKLLGLIQDITEQRRAEESRAALEDRLRQAQKMEAIAALAGGIAHDFNNILTAILTHAELLQADLPPEHPDQEGLCEILKAGRRAQALVAQLLALSRQRQPSRKPVQLQEVLGESLRMLRAALPPQVAIEPRPTTERPWVLAEPTQIHQLLLGLGMHLGHALGQGGGRIEVGLAVIQPEAAPAQAAAGTHPGLFVRVLLTPSGPGLDAEALERALGLAAASPPAADGPGEALGAVHAILRDHGGTLTVSRQATERGLTLHLDLPAATPQAGPEPAGAAQAPTGQGEHVLVVDDEEALARVAVTCLERMGYRATAVTTPAEALAMLQARPHAVHLVVTDLTMPQMSGLELARHFRAVRPDLPIVLASGYGDTLNAEQLRQAGITELLAKPFEQQTLAETLRRALDRGRLG